jgi:hypothetical protein
MEKNIPIYVPPTIPPNLKGVDITSLSLSLSLSLKFMIISSLYFMMGKAHWLGGGGGGWKASK